VKRKEWSGEQDTRLSPVDRLESGTLTRSPEELRREQAIVDSLDATPREPDPEALARFICFGPGDWP
jgi:hypothetical protein